MTYSLSTPDTAPISIEGSHGTAIAECACIAVGSSRPETATHGRTHFSTNVLPYMPVGNSSSSESIGPPEIGFL